jgi:hypothetical protein
LRPKTRPQLWHKTLCVLLDTLELTQDALRKEHPRLQYPLIPSNPALPTSELLAELLLERCSELAALIQRYNDVLELLDLQDDNPVPF